MCEQNVPRFQIWVWQTFSNSIYLILLEQQVNSGAMFISAVFGTRDYVVFRKVFLGKSF